VRTAAAEALVKFCDAVAMSHEQIQSDILPPLKTLAADHVQPVRAALAEAVLQLAPKLAPVDSAGYLELINVMLKDKVLCHHIAKRPVFCSASRSVKCSSQERQRSPPTTCSPCGQRWPRRCCS
jgi:hypothetical protein